VGGKLPVCDGRIGARATNDLMYIKKKYLTHIKKIKSRGLSIRQLDVSSPLIEL
jgi:D-mannonate dehydratase